jgi:hypothetical protein
VPTHNQNTVDAPPGGNGKLGAANGLSRSNTASLKVSFPGSPIHTEDMTRESIQKQFQELALDGEVKDGYCFSSFNRDYKNAPAIKDVKVGPGGWPGSPHMPNPVSPGAGSANPGDMAAPPPDLEKNKTSRPPYIGEGTALDPATSSIRQSGMKVKSYIMGKSDPASVGAYNKVK